jgi:hypothetical protein
MNENTLSHPLFPIGQLVATPGSLALLEQSSTSPFELIRRHQRGDWGDLCESDRKANDEAVINGTRILSCYVIGQAQCKIWAITESDRCATTLLLASEY